MLALKKQTYTIASVSSGTTKIQVIFGTVYRSRHTALFLFIQVIFGTVYRSRHTALFHFIFLYTAIENSRKEKTIYLMATYEGNDREGGKEKERVYL